MGINFLGILKLRTFQSFADSAALAPIRYTSRPLILEAMILENSEENVEKGKQENVLK